MTINFDTTKQVTVSMAVTLPYNKVKLLETRDNGSSVLAILQYCNDDTISDTQTPILWEGDAYVAIGQWTDADVQNRLKELLSL